MHLKSLLIKKVTNFKVLGAVWEAQVHLMVVMEDTIVKFDTHWQTATMQL